MTKIQRPTRKNANLRIGKDPNRTRNANAKRKSTSLNSTRSRTKGKEKRQISDTAIPCYHRTTPTVITKHHHNVRFPTMGICENEVEGNNSQQTFKGKGKIKLETLTAGSSFYSEQLFWENGDQGKNALRNWPRIGLEDWVGES